MGLWNYLFNKKEVGPTNKDLYGTETPVFTNPPAKELALVNRREKHTKQLTHEYNNLIKKINSAIENGQLYTACWGVEARRENRTKKYKYLTPEVNLYIAARKLRKDGFKVKLKTETYYARESETGVQLQPITCSSYVEISWK